MKQLNILATVIFILIAIPLLLLAPLVRQDFGAENNNINDTDVVRATLNPLPSIQESIAEIREEFSQPEITISEEDKANTPDVKVVIPVEIKPAFISSQSQLDSMEIEEVKLVKPKKRISLIKWLLS